ncbi:acyclic terpene utilization AtuA family protein [Niameybacter massiliensis]|uniref:acyclic terpene utilization AtuA family protein n=1 Tax=Niameybacter massiliensis TaxID=1658108 RepID=UPI0006B544D1|nr:acyclic terpene utilization AtuA family protein [Niameybacter massiliensis]
MAFKILSPCGILGYGYPLSSFMAGINEQPDAIVVDAGSTDAGPHKLGAGVPIVSKNSCKKDLLPMITEGINHKIPVIIGSAGGSGAKKHVNWTLDIIQSILKEQGLKNVKIAIIWGDIASNVVKERLAEGKVTPLGKMVKELTPEIIDKTNGIVAQMGEQPIIEALKAGADIIVCGRAYDPSPFAAPAILNGYNPAFAYHLGKILECAALCCEPGTTKDCMLGIINEDNFEVVPLNPIRKCTKVSVAAHTFYEKDHPYLLKGPGITMNLKNCTFEEIGNGSVRVRGSQINYDDIYRIKLEGAMPVAFRTFVIAGIRDPLLIAKLELVEDLVKDQVQEYYKEFDPSTYAINFINYGINGVMGDIEPINSRGHEVCVLMEVLANTQEIASTICASLRSTFLHYGYEGRKSTAGNLAFPFAPSDVEFGQVYEFSVYHLMEVKSGNELFKIDYLEV